MAHSVEASILEPWTYTRSVPRSGIAKIFKDGLNKWLNVPEDKMEIISAIGCLLRDPALMLDDIQDGSPLRRGHPAAHKVYGEAQTICAVNYAILLCNEKILALRGDDFQVQSSELFAILVTELKLASYGQGLEILWRDTLSCPSEEEYMYMIHLKTGSAFRVMVRFMMVFATTNQDVDYMPLGNLLAAFFQIRDDYLNLQSQEYTVNKGFAEDLTEGKFSFPVIHSIHADQTNQKVLNVLEKRPSTPTLKIETIEYMRTHTRSMDYTSSVLSTLHREIFKEIRGLGGNEVLELFMDQLHVVEDYLC